MNDPHLVTRTATFPSPALRGVLRDEWPSILVLALALFGIAYTTVFRTPMTIYWIAVAPVIGAICIFTRWHELASRDERVRMAWRQAWHWVAVIVAMHLMFVIEVTRTVSADDIALAALVLLALGTFTAGIHLAAWRICLVGAIMAAGATGIAWVGWTALLWILAALVVVAVIAPVAWHLLRTHKPKVAPQPKPTPS
jgi:hypothetical protein